MAPINFDVVFEESNQQFNVQFEPNGSSGTTNYNSLSNKPKINNTELSGNKSAADLGLAAAAALAPEYSSSSTYAVGDLVLKDGQLYECNTTIGTAEAWNSSHWTSKTVADELSSLNGDYTDLDNRVTALEQGGSGGGLTADIKAALLQLAAKVAYVDDDGQDYYQDLYDAFYGNLDHISCVYTQSGTVYNTTSLDDLKSDLVVTAHMSDNTTSVIPSSYYTLTGTLTVGTSTIGVSYAGKTTTFTVTVTADSVSSISAAYVQSGTVTNHDTLDSLKNDLAVTASWASGASTTVASADYTLSGTLATGTSTITVTYENKTTTFNVTVTDYWTTVVFERGALSKPTSGTNKNYIFPSSTTTARARFVAPIPNNGDTLTVTDSTKYNLCAYDPTTDVPVTITEMGVQYQAYLGSTKSISWKSSDSVSTSYIWVSFKKMDNTDFTDQEIANMYGTVFTVS